VIDLVDNCMTRRQKPADLAQKDGKKDGKKKK